jgi:hypothetical protein
MCELLVGGAAEMFFTSDEIRDQVFCGILSRVWQFSDILADAKKQQQQASEMPEQEPQRHKPCCQAILGDLNTMGHRYHSHLLLELICSICQLAMLWLSSCSPFWSPSTAASSLQNCDELITDEE